MCRITMFGLGRVVLMSMVAVVLAPGKLTAQLTDADRTRLAAEIAAAAENLDASRLPDFDVSKQIVLDRMAAVDQFLTLRTTAANREAWLKYLDLDPLKDAITSEKSLTEVAREAVELRYRLITTSPGLELHDIRSLRDSVEVLIEAIRYRDKEKSLTVISKQLESMSQRISELADSPSSEDVATITAIVGRLDSSGQAEDAVRSLRNTFNRPNVAVLIGEPLIQQVVYQDVHETRPVRDCILGTRIVGTATLSGAVTANLVPSFGTARMQVALAGHLVSKNRGYNGPVQLQTSGYGDVTATRTVNFNESGISMDTAYVHAQLRTEINAIEHRLRIVRKIARKKAAETKPKADRIAVEKMRQQVGEQFISQTDEAAAITPPDAMAKIRPVLQRLSLQEPTRFWGSTDDNVFIDTTFRRSDQLSAVVSRPPITVPYDAAIQVHESVINNAFSPILAGRTLTESQLNKLLEGAGRPAAGSKPTPQGEDSEPEPPFEIEFARLQPIVFEARDQTIRVGIRGLRFTSGNRELKSPMEIAAIYRPGTTSDGKTILLRDGDVDVSFPNKRLTVRQAGLKPTIQKKFADVFPDVLLDRPLEIPSTASISQLQGRVFHPRLVEASNGWLTIAVR